MADNMTAAGLSAIEHEYQAIVQAKDAELKRARAAVNAIRTDLEVAEARLGGAIWVVLIAFILGFVVGVVL